MFPTCLVEYQNPAIGQDLVKVYERNGIECSPAGRAGLLRRAVAAQRRRRRASRRPRSRTSKAAGRRGRRTGDDIVVPQPTCGYVLKKDYLDYVGGPDADLVAAHTYDAAEYLMKLHKGEGTALDTDFRGDVPADDHLPRALPPPGPEHRPEEPRPHEAHRRQGHAGAECSGIDGTWGLRAENAELSRPDRPEAGRRASSEAGGEVVAGDCHLANSAIVEQTGRAPLHPLQVVARAYGIPPRTR